MRGVPPPILRIISPTSNINQVITPEWLRAALRNFEYRRVLSAVPDALLFPLCHCPCKIFIREKQPRSDASCPPLLSLPPVSLNKHTHLTNGPPERATVVIYAPVETIPLRSVPDYECQFQATPGVHPSLGRGKKNPKHLTTGQILTASSLLSLPSSHSFPPCEDGAEHDFIWRRGPLCARKRNKNVRGLAFNQKVEQCNNVNSLWRGRGGILGDFKKGIFCKKNRIRNCYFPNYRSHDVLNSRNLAQAPQKDTVVLLPSSCNIYLSPNGNSVILQFFWQHFEHVLLKFLHKSITQSVNLFSRPDAK